MAQRVYLTVSICIFTNDSYFVLYDFVHSLFNFVAQCEEYATFCNMKFWREEK